MNSNFFLLLQKRCWSFSHLVSYHISFIPIHLDGRFFSLRLLFARFLCSFYILLSFGWVLFSWMIWTLFGLILTLNLQCFDLFRLNNVAELTANHKCPNKTNGQKNIEAKTFWLVKRHQQLYCFVCRQLSWHTTQQSTLHTAHNIQCSVFRFPGSLNGQMG